MSPRPTPFESAFYAAPPGMDDPLQEAAARFAAARTHVGIGALMRRFKIGPVRARVLLDCLYAQRVLMRWDGWSGKKVGGVNMFAWAALLPPPVAACEYWRGTWQCRGDGFLWDADCDGYDPTETDDPCPRCNVSVFLERAKEEAETCSSWSNGYSSGTGESLWLSCVARVTEENPEVTAAVLAALGPVRALVDADNDEGCEVRLHNAAPSPVTDIA